MEVRRQHGLRFVGSAAVPLSPAQAEFNRLLKRVEAARAKQARERARLDQAMATVAADLLPLIGELNRANRDIVRAGARALETMKLTARRRHWLTDLLCGKAGDLLGDPVGLGDDDLAELGEIFDRLAPIAGGDDSADETNDAINEQFDELRVLLEATARMQGIDLDLSGIDLQADPAELERLLAERMNAAGEAFQQNRPVPRRRKPTKAQLERERARQQIEEAKTRDMKSLFKQLAKALHPDLDADPARKEHREAWMKRLNGAYERNDLRDMLAIEMEWLGEERAHLSAASEEKLRVYCVVLKEQVADLDRQTHTLFTDPQYEPLRRFMNPLTGRMANAAIVRIDLLDEVERHRAMLAILEGPDPARRRMVHSWADEHARAASRMPFPF